MELRHLRYFVAVAEEQNVTRAAARLRIAQPAVSRQIRDLEDELDFPLLERSAKAVRLTEAGRIFLGEARAVLRRAEQAVAAARTVASGARGTLHVGYAPSLTVQILPLALRSFQTEFPGVRVALHDLSTEEMHARLRSGKLHLALTVQPAPGSLRGLHFQELARYKLCLAVPPNHALAQARSVSRARVSEEPLIGYTQADYPDYHTALAALFSTPKGKLRLAEEHDSGTSLIAAVEAGRGVALVPSCLACMVGPRLKLVPLSPTTRPIIVGALRRAGPVPSAAIENFILAARAG